MRTLRLPRIRNELYLGMFLMIIKVSLSQSSIVPYNEAVDNFLSLFAAFLLAFYIVKEKYSIKTLFIYAFIALVALYSTVKTGNNGFLITIITCLAIRNQDMDRVIDFIFRYEAIFLVIHTLLAVPVTLFSSHSIVSMIDGAKRYNFGFGHPNTFSIYLFNLILMWIWLNYKRITKQHIFLIMCIGFVSYLFTKTRTAFIVLILLVVLLFLSGKKDKSSRTITFIAKFIVPGLAIFLLIFIMNYTTGHSIVRFLDTILSNRIKLGAYGFANYGITMFGDNMMNNIVVWDSYWRLNSHTFDCLYSYLAMNQGLIWLIISSVLFFALAKKSDMKINICIIVWAFYGITEVHGLNGYQCFPVLLLVLLFNHKKVISTKNNVIEE